VDPRDGLNDLEKRKFLVESTKQKELIKQKTEDYTEKECWTKQHQRK
jgi:hypothetical protein